MLLDIDSNLSNDDVSDSHKEKLGTILESCERLLKDAQNTLHKYRELEKESKGIGKAAKRAWKRLTFEPDDIRELRSRIVSNITALNFFLERFTRGGVSKLSNGNINRTIRKPLTGLPRSTMPHSNPTSLAGVTQGQANGCLNRLNTNSGLQ